MEPIGNCIVAVIRPSSGKTKMKGDEVQALKGKALAPKIRKKLSAGLMLQSRSKTIKRPAAEFEFCDRPDF